MKTANETEHTIYNLDVEFSNTTFTTFVKYDCSL